MTRWKQKYTKDNTRRWGRERNERREQEEKKLKQTILETEREDKAEAFKNTC